MKTKWTIIGLAEVRRKGENCITLKSGHILFYNEEHKIGEVRILINKSEAANLSQYHVVSERVISIDTKVNNKYKCKKNTKIQVYALT